MFFQPEERKAELRKHPFFQLHCEVRNGKGLIAMDRGGTSDPYLKCTQARLVPAAAPPSQRGHCQTGVRFGRLSERRPKTGPVRITSV